MDKKERNRTAILSRLARAAGPTHSRQLAESLSLAGYRLSERTVRLYLGEMDAEGLTVSRGRRGRTITCEYDITHEDVIEARHFDDDVFVYSYHDQNGLHVKDGGTYGIPYRALIPRGIENLLVAGMLITTDRRPHQSTRNTVNCMGQGQATGTAAALCALKNKSTRDLKYGDLRDVLAKDNVYFES